MRFLSYLHSHSILSFFSHKLTLLQSLTISYPHTVSMHYLRLSTLLSIFFVQALSSLAAPTPEGLPLDMSSLPLGSVAGPSNLLSSASTSNSPTLSKSDPNSHIPVAQNLAMPLSMPHIPTGTESLGGLSGLTQGLGLAGSKGRSRLVKREAQSFSNEESLNMLARKRRMISVKRPKGFQREYKA